MKKLTAIILSACLGATGLTGCQAEVSKIPVASSQAADTGRQQVGKEPKEETKSQEDSAGEPGAPQSDGTAITTDHVGSQVKIPREVNRVVATDILPLPSIIMVFLGSGGETVGMVLTSMSVARTGLLGGLFPNILNVSTGSANDSDINMEGLMKLEPDVVFYSTGSEEIGEALRSAGLAAVAVSVNKWNYDNMEAYDQWTSPLGRIFPGEGNTAEQVSRYSRNIYEDIQDKVSGSKDEEKRDILFLFNYSDTTTVTSSKKFFGQFWHDVVGDRNVAGGVAAENSNAAINMEQVYEWDLGIIFITNFTSVQPEDLHENAAGQDDWNPVKTVQDENVYKLPLGTYRSYTPNTDTPMTLLWMAKQICSDLFSDVDMTQEVKDYYKEPYGVDSNGEQVQRTYHPGSVSYAYL